MKIYNEDKTKELKYEDLDFTKGHLIVEEEIVHHEAQEYVAEEGHYEVLAEYPNGGKDVEWIIDIPGQEKAEAYDEKIVYNKYILYTENQLKINEYNNQINEYKQLLNKTDYLAIKYAEGWLTAEEYAPLKAERQGYRDKVNELQDEINALKEKDVHE